MATLDFPTDPQVDDVFEDWTWDGDKWIVTGGAGGGAGIEEPVGAGVFGRTEQGEWQAVNELKWGGIIGGSSYTGLSIYTYSGEFSTGLYLQHAANSSAAVADTAGLGLHAYQPSTTYASLAVFDGQTSNTYYDAPVVSIQQRTYAGTIPPALHVEAWGVALDVVGAVNSRGSVTGYQLGGVDIFPTTFGTAGQVMTSAGSGNRPTWQNSFPEVPSGGSTLYFRARNYINNPIWLPIDGGFGYAGTVLTTNGSGEYSFQPPSGLAWGASIAGSSGTGVILTNTATSPNTDASLAITNDSTDAIRVTKTSNVADGLYVVMPAGTSSGRGNGIEVVNNSTGPLGGGEAAWAWNGAAVKINNQAPNQPALFILNNSNSPPTAGAIFVVPGFGGTPSIKIRGWYPNYYGDALGIQVGDPLTYGVLDDVNGPSINLSGYTYGAELIDGVRGIDCGYFINGEPLEKNVQFPPDEDITVPQGSEIPAGFYVVLAGFTGLTYNINGSSFNTASATDLGTFLVSDGNVTVTDPSGAHLQPVVFSQAKPP